MVNKMYPLWLIYRYRDRPWERPYRGRGSLSRLPRGISHLHHASDTMGPSQNLPFPPGQEA